MDFWKFGIIMLLLLGAISCKRDKGASNDRPNLFDEHVIPDKSFAPFYDQFHEDSVYQMAHIMFPLQGLPSSVDSATLASQSYYWQKDDWVLHGDFDEESGFDRSIVAVAPDVVEEKLVNKEVGLAIMRRFAKLDGEWYLIYYAGMNQFK